MRTAIALSTVLGICITQTATAQTDIARADAAIRAFMDKESIPAAHVTILRGDTVILQRGYGSAGANGRVPDASTIFPLGSISKQFTAATILALANAGKIRLDARVGEYLPAWFANEPDLRVAHLLSQTSGVQDFLWLEGYRPLASDPGTPIEAYVALAAAAPRRFPPGTRWSYSNSNYKALALIAERVTRQRFDRLLADLVLSPAGIEGIVPCHSLRPDQFVPGGQPTPLDARAAAYIGDGGLCASAVPLSRWIRRVLASREGSATQLARPSQLADGTQVPYGFGLSIREFGNHRMVWHGGNVDSHTTMIAFAPDEDLGVVILTNKGFLWLTELMPALLGDAPAARTTATAPSLSGQFEDGLFRFEVTPDGAALRVHIDLIDTLRFIPAGPREYVAETYPATFRIRLPADGSHDRFEFDWGELRSYARRVKP